MKKILLLLTIVLLSTVSAFAQGGTTGPLTWELNDSTLTISGEGEMPDYVYPDVCAPWYEYRNSICSVVIENGVTSIGYCAFLTCISLTSVTIPNSVTSIGQSAFYVCISLTSVTIPNSVTSIGINAFCWCSSLSSVTIGNSVISIGQGAFWDCSSLTSVTIPNSVTSIGIWAFRDCSSLTSVTIGNSVTSIGYYAFVRCPLTVITNLNPIPIEIYSDTFDEEIQSTCTLKVLPSAVSAYQNAEVWKEFNIIGIYSVSVSVNNEEYGTATGSGYYDENGTATVTATAHTGYKFVNWTKDNVEVSTENPYSFTVIEDVELVANFTNDVGVVETHNCASLQVFPNPTTGILNLIQEHVTNVEIFDIYGKKLSSHHLIPSSPNHHINISHLSAGIYFLKIGNETVKVVKQ